MSHHPHDAFHDDGPPIAQLQAAVKTLDDYVQRVVPPSASLPPPPPPVAAQSQGPTPLQRFARQERVAGRWRDVSRAHVAVCGLGGPGAVAAEALVRAGVGRVFLVDHARVELSAMGRVVFQPHEVGVSRTQALRLRLQSIASSHTVVDSFTADLRSDMDLLELRKKLKISSVGPTALKPPPGSVAGGSGGGLGLFEALTQKRPYDAVLGCVDGDDDDDALLALNAICLELSLPLLVAELSPSDAQIAVRTVLPGRTCCLECIRHAAREQEASRAMDDVAATIARAFPASLPHVELLAGGLLAQHTLKFLMEVGDVVPFYSLDAFAAELESFAFAPNPQCPNAVCQQLQQQEAATESFSS
ncbi:hypothetical protein P43SY_008249 [Pythium insidiosum]|uniref:Ubiquitin-like modifier-activating enzyme 5 n=1 Tax=Pythium insidiosum TaxID=114742 RepID=A0AAD5M4Y9_PYTIN|nr:hypothetical protein P43SY_008249 [Pythium insidiosum]